MPTVEALRAAVVGDDSSYQAALKRAEESTRRTARNITDANYRSSAAVRQVWADYARQQKTAAQQAERDQKAAAQAAVRQERDANRLIVGLKRDLDREIQAQERQIQLRARASVQARAQAEREAARLVSQAWKDSVREQEQTARRAAQARAAALRQARSDVREAFGGLGMDLTLGVTLPLAAMAAKSIQTASAVTEAQNRVRVVFGESGRAIRHWAATSGAAMGQSERAALQVAGTFGQMFRSLDIGEQQAAQMSLRMIQLASDLASFSDIPVEDALQKIRSGLAGEIEPLRSVGVFLNEARVRDEAYRTGIAKTGEELTEQQKVLARYSLILRLTSLAHGDFTRTSDEMQNSVRQLLAELENEATALGKDLIPIAKDAIRVGRDLLAQWRQLPEPLRDAAFRFTMVAAALGPVISLGTRAATLFAGFRGLQVLATLQAGGGLAAAAAAGTAGAGAGAAAGLGTRLLGATAATTPLGSAAVATALGRMAVDQVAPSGGSGPLSALRRGSDFLFRFTPGGMAAHLLEMAAGRLFGGGSRPAGNTPATDAARRGELYGPPRSGAPGAVTSDPQDAAQRAQRLAKVSDAVFEARIAQARALAATSPEAQQAQAEADRLVPLLRARQKELADRFKGVEAGSEEAAKLQTESWELEGQITELQSAAAKARQEAAKKAAEAAKRLAEQWRQAREAQLDWVVSQARIAAEAAPEGQGAQTEARAVIPALVTRYRALAAEAMLLAPQVASNAEAAERYWRLQNEMAQTQTDAAALQRRSLEEVKKNTETARKQSEEVREAQVQALRAQAEALASGAPDDREARISAQHLLPFLKTQQERLAREAQALLPSTKDYHEATRRMWEARAEVSRLERAAADEEKRAAERARDEQRKSQQSALEAASGRVALAEAQLKTLGAAGARFGNRREAAAMLPLLLQQFQAQSGAVRGESEAEKLSRLTDREGTAARLLELVGALGGNRQRALQQLQALAAGSGQSPRAPSAPRRARPTQVFGAPLSGPPTLAGTLPVAGGYSTSVVDARSMAVEAPAGFYLPTAPGEAVRGPIAAPVNVYVAPDMGFLRHDPEFQADMEAAANRAIDRRFRMRGG